MLKKIVAFNLIYEYNRFSLHEAPWSRVLLKKLIVSQLMEKFPSYYDISKTRYLVYKSPSLVPILNQVNPVHASAFHPVV
jgi:hypothetical protein